MSAIGPVIGIALMAGAISYGVWHAWLLYQRGVKDRVWIFNEANTAAQFVTVILLTHLMVRFFINGATLETMIWVAMAIILIPTPYIFYASGRAVGIWQRSRALAMRASAY